MKTPYPVGETPDDVLSFGTYFEVVFLSASLKNVMNLSSVCAFTNEQVSSEENASSERKQEKDSQKQTRHKHPRRILDSVLC